MGWLAHPATFTGLGDRCRFASRNFGVPGVEEVGTAIAKPAAELLLCFTPNARNQSPLRHRSSDRRTSGTIVLSKVDMSYSFANEFFSLLTDQTDFAAGIA